MIIKRQRTILVALVCAVGLLFVCIILFVFYRKNAYIRNPSFPEITELEQTHLSPKDFLLYFQKLAETKGAVYAFAVLKTAPVPPYTGLHIIGHAIGDILYKQEGAEGIAYCTQDFKNACSHSIVIGLFKDKGEAAFPEITTSCQRAPGGPGAYATCFHGLGHGVLAVRNYDIAQAVKTCRTMNSSGEQKQEFSECVGGIIMESISGGGHNQATWQKQYDHYYKGTDPLSPCNTDLIPEEAKSTCYGYLTPELFMRAGTNTKHPTEESLRTAFSYCNPLTDPKIRLACYGGFGKEFTGMAHLRYALIKDPVTDQMLGQVNEWCSFAQAQGGIRACILYAYDALFWGGEGDRDATVRFCAVVTKGNSENGDACYKSLAAAARHYITNTQGRSVFCSALPSEYKTQCLP